MSIFWQIMFHLLAAAFGSLLGPFTCSDMKWSVKRQEWYTPWYYYVMGAMFMTWIMRVLINYFF